MAEEYQGFCPICEKDAFFCATSGWYRDALLCQSCEGGSLPRERALALVLEQQRPNWRNLRIHESSPAARGISLKLQRQCRNYLASHYFADVPRGDYSGQFRSEDIQNQTFDDCQFDLFVSLDVFEHVFEPDLAIKEIWRTLRPGGAMISTWPVLKSQVEPLIRRARLSGDSVDHLLPPQYHGNPIGETRSLVTIDYGYDIHKFIEQTAAFDVSVRRFADKTHGVIGEFTEVFWCEKRRQP